MRREGFSLRMGSVAGIPIRLHGSLLAAIGLFLVLRPTPGLSGVAMVLLGAVALFGSVLAHELGHALAARRLGLRTADISLYPFGGIARLVDLPRTARQELIVAVAGPLVSAALAGLSLLLALLAGPSGALRGGLELLAGINLTLTLFNLLPALPMDGGRVLRALLASRMGFARATETSSGIGRWLAFAMIGAGLLLPHFGLGLAGVVVLFLGAREARLARAGVLGYGGWRAAPAAGQPSGGTWGAVEPDTRALLAALLRARAAAAASQRTRPDAPAQPRGQRGYTVHHTPDGGILLDVQKG